MKKVLLKFHLRYMVHGARYYCQRWGEKSFIIVLAILIGVVTALAAAGLHELVVFFKWCSQKLVALGGDFYSPNSLAIFFILPLVGLTLSYFVQRYFGGSRYAKSLSPLILALNRKRTSIPLSETVTHIFSSALSVGFGGSAGLEAPSVLTGSAIGANAGSLFGMAKKKKSLLLGCGAAAAIAAIFDSPIAGVLFAAEVLLPEFRVSSLVPMLLSAAVSAVLSHIMMGKAQFFLAINAPWHSNAVPYYVLCAIFCAVVGILIIRAAYYISKLLKKHFRNPWQRLFVGGTILCVILFFFPALRGQGYSYISKLFASDTNGITNGATILEQLSNHPGVLIVVLFVVIFLKIIASVLTVDSGGDGGIFAPSMFIGAVCGFTFARLINLTGIIELQEFNFVAIGMCGVFTAVMRAPLTGIFLIAEVTGGYILLAPLMIVSSVSFLVARFFEPHSIYRKPLVENNLLSDDSDVAMLQRMPVRLNLTHDYPALKANGHLGEVAQLIEEHNTTETFPVLDDEKRLIGVLYREKVLAAMLNLSFYNHLLIFDLMEDPPIILSAEDDLAKAMQAFDRSSAEALPVCDNENHLLGFVEKAPIFARYRRLVKEADSSF